MSKQQHDHRPEASHVLWDGRVADLQREAGLGAAFRASVLERVARALDRDPQQIVDLGAGIGTDVTALAVRFPTARVTALDVSDPLLEQVAAAARAAGVEDRVDTRNVDLNRDWAPEFAQGVDLAWAALSLHHLDDPASALRQVFAALRPGGVFALIELRGAVRPAPSDLGTGVAGLADRVAAALSAPAEYADIDWATLLEEAGFTSVSRSDHDVIADGSTPDGAEYLDRQLRTLLDRLAPGFVE